MRLAVVLALLGGCIYESGGHSDRGDGSIGVPPPDGFFRDSIAFPPDVAANGCNPRNGEGCLCTMGCPALSDACVFILTGSAFCSNTCTPATEAIDCQVLPGQPGRGVCQLTLNMIDGGTSGPDHCVILCDNMGRCPAGMVGIPQQLGCICVGA